MSGHSKWHTIKHKKGAADAKRGKIFTRLIKELTVAARSGGGDPGMNPRLRTIIAAAKEVNMPADNIKKAIQRGTGELPGIVYEEITYEAYGPGGSALIIETMTDNKNRTVGELRHMLEKHAGNLGSTNSVAWMFAKKGLIVVEKAKADEEKLLSIALEAGADDMADEGDNWEVLSDPSAFEAVRDAVKASGVEPASAQVAMLPQNYVKLTGAPANPDDPLDGRARRSRRRQAGVVKLRHRGEGDRGLTGVRVFGIDPGSDRTGYGCIDSDGRRHQLVGCGAVRAGAGATFPDQLSIIYRELRALLEEHQPECVAIENIFYAMNARSALKLGHARGVAMLAAIESGVTVVEYTPAEIKRAVVGYGRAEKPQVGQMVKLLLGLDAIPKPHDAADALAVAICHLHTGRPKRRAADRVGQAAA